LILAFWIVDVGYAWVVSYGIGAVVVVVMVWREKWVKTADFFKRILKNPENIEKVQKYIDDGTKSGVNQNFL